MNPGARVTFTNKIDGKSGIERDGQEATVTIGNHGEYTIRFDDGFHMYATAAELARVAL
ncbi:hypothetical protein [Cryobacterium sp. Hh11]|uniref:hypothetical protein n=1 Tax=Cryobacterium sp. Hh11 TaxID=2555868 RepID=UPI00141BDC6A|nr:hypothetical protein [Cryobacterium sp. Hh11]